MPHQPWSDDAIRHLHDATSCPRCGVDALSDRRCLNCGADLRGEIADRLWAASTAAVTALQTRQQILDLVPVNPVAAAPAAAPAAASVVQDAAVAAPANAAAPQAERSSATVQSVLAVAGAGLFAVAAIVFTFFNPQLTDHVLRSVIVGVVTVVFLGGAWMLARRGLQFSAEAVGALGMVFVALDVYAVSEAAPAAISPWVFAAIGTLVSAIVMIAVSALARIRSWLLVAVVGLATVPAMIGYAGHDAGLGLWPTVLGHVAVGFAVLALLEVIRKLDPRFPGTLTADRVTLTVLQIVAVGTAVIQLPFAVETSASTTAYWLSVAGTLAALAVLSILASRNLVRGFWSFVAGGFAVSAVSVLPFALDLDPMLPYLALVPAAAAVALIALAVLPTPATISRPLLTAGVLVMSAVAAVTTIMLGAGMVLYRMLAVTQRFSGTEDPFSADGGISLVLGLVAISLGLAVYTFVGTRKAGAATIGLRVAGAAAVSLLMLGALAFASWSAWQPVIQIVIAIAVSVITSVLLLFVPFVRAGSLALRFPAITGAHLALVLAALLSWADQAFTVYAGIAIVGALVLVARTIRTADHPIHWGVGYAYSLVLVARALDLIDVFSTPANFSLTTSVGAAAAIAATLIRRLRAPAWYAVLIVTGVPFLIGVAIVIGERSGWAALSSGMIFLLALTLLLTRRPGLNVGVRAVAAGLLVPTLAVVVTNLAAQFLELSGSLVALPVIAVIVAGVLPSTGLIASALRTHGIPDHDASLARVFIEGSALLTGVIAVLLALVLPAAGLGTAFIVLIVLGVGAAATAIWGKRRYGWWVSFASFTGALWCVWALQGITLIEPYLLPPALALAIIGVIVTGRGGRGLPLYATGLAVATIPVLGILAVVGSDDAPVEWRGYAMIAAAWVLLLIGAVIGNGAREWMKRLKVLSLPTLGIAIITGSAGAIQAIRFGVHADRLAADGWGRLLGCLALGAAGALAAAAAARAAIDDAPESALARSRWMYAPAALYIALSVVTLKPGHFDWASIWTMWAVMFLLLAFMIVVVLRARREQTTLPPVWFLFALAFVVAIVGWSARDLRVEVFSVPLGLMLLGAGVLGMLGVSDSARPAVPTVNSWPVGPRGSWPLLTPGIVVLFSASVSATVTDPTIWRAVGVIVAALLAILVGAQLKLAAPFFLGIIVLPIENILVFAVQVARGIDSVPWWITLAVVGAVLLIIAVTYERRSGADGSITARLRDLR